MKQLVVVLFLTALAVALGTGCATMGQRSARAFTAQEQAYLDEFNQLNLGDVNLAEEDPEFFERFPLINPDPRQMSDANKVFVMMYHEQVATALAEAQVPYQVINLGR